MMNGRSRRRRRSSSAAERRQQRDGEQVHEARDAAARRARPRPSPWNGSRAIRTASTTVSTANAGHCHAPRSRQRSRRNQTDSTIVAVKRNPPCRRLTATSTPSSRGDPARPDRRTPGDPGRRTDTRRERTARWRPKPLEPDLPPDVTEHLTTEDRVGLLRAMLMMRGIEERAMTLYRQGKVPGASTTASARRRCPPGRRGRWPPRTACASCTATSPRTSSAASSRGGSSPSTWAARTASRAAATATCTSATARRAASG